MEHRYLRKQVKKKKKSKLTKKECGSSAHNLSISNNSIVNVETNSSSEESNTKKKDKKEKKKDEDGGKKKDKKKKDKQKLKGFKSPSLLGTPVVPTILTRPSPPIHDLQQGDTSSILSDSSLSQDPITIQNTIRNGSIDVTPALPTPINTQQLLSSSSTTSSDDDNYDDDEIVSPSGRKFVTFSNETAIGVAASVKADAEKEKKKEKKKDEKKKDKKKKNKDNMASINKCSGYANFTSHPYTTHPIVKFKKMKMKHCKRLPEVPKDDPFLQQIHDRLKLSNDC